LLSPQTYPWGANPFFTKPGVAAFEVRAQNPRAKIATLNLYGIDVCR
jgi:hypothetical protein